MFTGAFVFRLLQLTVELSAAVSCSQGIEGLCCGMMFDSRGAKTAAALKTQQAVQALHVASELGKLPIVTDTSPCLAHFKSSGALNNDTMR